MAMRILAVLGVASTVLGAAFAAAPARAQPPSYLTTRKIEHVDDYHGTKVADPYRWLEDETSPETAAWIEAQNAVTFPYLERIPYRQKLLERVMQLNDYERYSAPSRKGAYFFFSKNEGLQNQSVLFIQEGLERRARGADRPERVVGGRHRAAQRVRAVERREVRGLRHLAQRLGLAAVQGDGARDEAHAAGHGRLGEGVERRVARRRLLLQPLSRAARRAREGVDQREPPGVLPQARHGAGAGHARLRGSREPRSASTCSIRPRTSASRSSRSPSAAKARTATRCSCAISRRR